MGFKLYFEGLTCLIRDSATEYTAVWPDGMNNPVDPCDPTMTIHSHEPFLIVPLMEIESSQIAGEIISHCFVASLAGVKTLSSDATDTPGTAADFSEADLKDGHHWSKFDSSFLPDKSKAAMTMTLKRGIMASQSVPFTTIPPDERSIFTAIDVASTSVKHRFLVDNRQVFVKDGARVLIANVAREWIDDATYPDADDHFNIYYKLSTNPPGCKMPAKKVAPDLISNHPFLEPVRSLRISCSNTIYP